MDKAEKRILAEELRNGDITTMENVFKAYYGKLLCFVNKLVKSREVSQDIVQDVFIKFWLNRENIDPKSSCIGLLYTMARNASLDFLKSKYSSIIPLMADVMEEPEPEASFTEKMLDSPDLEKKMEESLAGLPAQQQKVFRMSKIEHMSNKEIAQTLDLSVRTVEKHLELAKKNLRSKLS